MMRSRADTRRLRGLSYCVLTSLALGCTPSDEAIDPGEAEAEVLATLDRIFRAFVEQDRATLEATHAEEWAGFKAEGQSIEVGLDEYMDGVSFTYPMLRYSIDESYVQVMGDVAVVSYIARYWSDLEEFEGVLESRIRATDVCQRQSSGWVQTTSNLNYLPRPGAVSDEQLGEACFDIQFAEYSP